MIKDYTLEYYNKNASSFITQTQTVNFTAIQDRFLNLLPLNSLILDFGCGSGRDTKYFIEKGYQVEAIDGSIELCKIASEYTGIEVKNQLFQELDEKSKYDGIWACSSILHLTKSDLKNVLIKIEKALKPNGYFYTSFKYGDFEGIKNGRYYIDFTEQSLQELFMPITSFSIIHLWINEDVRKDRANEKWLNIIIKKII